MRTLCLVLYCLALSACVTSRAPGPPRPSAPWEQRLATLQQASSWQMAGRAAVAVGTQGWQASLDWRQNGATSEVHLAGPFGVGALGLTRTPDGVSLNGAPPSDAVQAQLEDKLGFDLPLDDLRFWLLGVPDPDSSADLTRNGEDRAQRLTQAGWTVIYDRYTGVDGDTLPAHLVLTREGVRVRIAVDHWEAPQ